VIIVPHSAPPVPTAIQNFAQEWGLSGFLMVPILNASSYWGGITLYQCEHQREFTPQEIALVQAVADQCAIAFTLTTLVQRSSTEFNKRQESQLALKESQRRLHALLEAIPDLIFRVTQDGMYLDYKPARDNTIPLGEREIIGKHLHQVLPTELAGLIWHHVELALETNEIQILEYQLWLNGKSHNFEVRVVKSGCDEVVVMIQDVTERVQTRVALEHLNDVLESRVDERTAALKEANRTLRDEIVDRKRIERALRASEERFRQAVVNAPFPIMIYAEDGEVLQINQVWTELTGYTHDEIPTLADWIEHAYKEDPETMRSRLAQLYNLHDRVDQGEFTLTPKKGANRIWYFSAAPLGQLPDSRRLLISMATDITERKKAEAEIKFLHSITQAIFECQDFHAALSVAIEKVCQATGWDFGEAWVPNVDSDVLECSSAWYSKTQSLVPFRNASERLTFSSGIGLPGRVWLLQKPEWRRDVSADSDQVYLRAQLAKEAGLKAALGIPLLTTNGVIAVLVFYMFESRDEDQRLINLISASTELGLMIQRKQAEGEIRKALEKEKELTELKSRFISMTSHEFRTPLTTIQSSAELLENYSHKWTEEKKITHLHRIQISVKHMTKLLNDVLIIGKVEAGKIQLNPVPINLGNFCLSLVEELQLNDKGKHTILFNYNEDNRTSQDDFELQADEVKIESSNHKPSSFMPIPCLDEQLLWQILENLLSNALKYSPVGSIVGLTLSCFPKQAVFQVCDRGIGIPKEDQARLFETFHRATNVGTIAGTGLGLAIVKKCADIHQGQIAVESEVGVGTTFTVTLPIYNWLSAHE
jgi:PAS domain S-box-containing protein